MDCLCSLPPKDRIDNITERKIFGQTDDIYDISLCLLWGCGFHSKSTARYEVLKNIYGF